MQYFETPHISCSSLTDVDLYVFVKCFTQCIFQVSYAVELSINSNINSILSNNNYNLYLTFSEDSRTCYLTAERCTLFWPRHGPLIM